MWWHVACDALAAKKRLEIRYDGLSRVVEVHAVGTTAEGNPVMSCPLLSGPISILGMATKEEWNGKEAQAGRHHQQAA